MGPSLRVLGLKDGDTPIVYFVGRFARFLFPIFHVLHFPTLQSELRTSKSVQRHAAFDHDDLPGGIGQIAACQHGDGFANIFG